MIVATTAVSLLGATDASAVRFATPAEVEECQAKFLDSVSARLVGTLGERTVRPDFKVGDADAPTKVAKRVTCSSLVDQTVTMTLLQRDASGSITMLAGKPLTRSMEEEKRDFDKLINNTYRYFTLPAPLSEATAQAGTYGVKFTLTASANPEWLRSSVTPPAPVVRDYTTWLTERTTMPRRRAISESTANRLARAVNRAGRNWWVLLNTNISRARNGAPGSTGRRTSSGPFEVGTYSARWRSNATPRQKAFLLVHAHTTVIFGERWYLYEPERTGPRSAAWKDLYIWREDGGASTVVFLLRPTRK